MTTVQALPRNVQRQLDEATALEAGLAQQIESAAKPAQSVRALLDPALAPASQQPVAHVQSATAAPGAPKDDFEHKYRVLQGMYEADVRKATARQNALDARLAAIEAAPPATTATAQPNKDDLDKFGADLIDMVKRYAENEMQGLKDRVTAVEQKVGSTQAHVVTAAKRSFFQELAALVPDYEQVNADPRWLEWLGTNNPLFGMPYQAALDHAQQAGDAQRTASVFKAYKATLPTAPAPDPGIQQQLEPDSAGNPVPPRSTFKPIISQKSITDFYNDLSRGKYVGREAEAAELETQINLAVAEGRVATNQ